MALPKKNLIPLKIFMLCQMAKDELIDGHIYYMAPTIVQTSETRHGAFRYHP